MWLPFTMEFSSLHGKMWLPFTSEVLYDLWQKRNCFLPLEYSLVHGKMRLIYQIDPLSIRQSEASVYERSSPRCMVKCGFFLTNGALW